MEKLADGSFIVRIDSVEYRALSADKIRELQQLKIEAERDAKIVEAQATELEAQRKIAELQTERADLKDKIAASAIEDLSRARQDANRWLLLFQSERELRKEGEQFIPRSSGSKWNKFFSLLDHPALQFGFKAAIPIWTAVKCQ